MLPHYTVLVYAMHIYNTKAYRYMYVYSEFDEVLSGSCIRAGVHILFLYNQTSEQRAQCIDTSVLCTTETEEHYTLFNINIFYI